MSAFHVDPPLRFLLALKFARSDDPALVQRALREARILASLDHPNIVRVFDLVDMSASGLGFAVVMEFLAGETLHELLLRERHLDLARACNVALGIAIALDHVHSRGVVHRDLKPPNVMIASDGSEKVRLIDFGLARPDMSTSTEPRLTATGDVLGTVLTMSPEQAFGERHLDARTDVWALGAILYRMLAGTYPVEGASIGGLLKAFQRRDIVALESRVKGLPLDVAAVVMQALEIDRGERLATIAPFIPILRRHANVSDRG